MTDLELNAERSENPAGTPGRRPHRQCRSGRKVGLSPSPCLRRTKQLEASGVIRGYVALLNRKMLGFGVEAFVQVSLDRHQDRLDRAFREAILAREEIVGCYVMTGEMDYLLHVLVRDLEAYGQFTMGVLLKMPGVKDVKSSLALEVVKDSTALPLERAEERQSAKR